MSINLKIGLAIVIVIAMIIMIKYIKDKKLKLSFSIFSIVIGILLIIALAIPSLIENLSNVLGFEVASNMLFLIAIFTIFYLIFNLMIIASAEDSKNVKLVQEVSLLKAKVEELEKKLNN